MDFDEQPSGCRYIFANSAAQAPSRFSALAEIFDPGTIRHLTDLGVETGWHCLEVGAGGGSVARWLAARVGEDGRVVATDVDTRWLETVRALNITVDRHDIGQDPLPEAAFDLVHARLVLQHVRDREAALARMVAALKPGGWILIEEFDNLSLLPDPGVNPAEVLLKTASALRYLMARRGVDLRYGRLLPSRLRGQGLVNVGVEGRVFMWQGSSPGARLWSANFEQLREAMIAAGLLTEQEIAEDLQRLGDADFMAPSPLLWSAWGRRSSATKH